jgi:hypothetical protein
MHAVATEAVSMCDYLLTHPWMIDGKRNFAKVLSLQS